MALLRRQDVTYEVFDDQGPALYNKYQGNWSHYTNSNFYNYTYTATPTTGTFLSFTFQGSEAWIYGGVLNINQTTGFPTANYVVDGVPAGPQSPYFYSTELIYFATPKLADGSHTINITVTGASDSNQYILDYITITPTLAGASSPAGSMTGGLPSPTSTSSSSTPVGAIVGGVVGGIAGIVILLLAGFFLFRAAKKKSGGERPYYFDKPSADNILAVESHVQPFTVAPGSPPPSSTGFTRGPQSAYSDGSSTQPLNPYGFGQPPTGPHPSQFTQTGPGGSGQTYVSSPPVRTVGGKASLMALQHDEPAPVQFQDSGIRFNQPAVQEAGPSQVPAEVPPTYSAS